MPDLLAEYLRLYREHVLAHVHVWAFTRDDRHVASFILHRDVDGAQAWGLAVAERYGQAVRFITMECDSGYCVNGKWGDRARWLDDERAERLRSRGGDDHP